jgi:hypothetical protein
MSRTKPHLRELWVSELLDWNTAQTICADKNVPSSFHVHVVPLPNAVLRQANGLLSYRWMTTLPSFLLPDDEGGCQMAEDALKHELEHKIKKAKDEHLFYHAKYDILARHGMVFYKIPVLRAWKPHLKHPELVQGLIDYLTRLESPDEAKKILRKGRPSSIDRGRGMTWTSFEDDVIRTSFCVADYGPYAGLHRRHSDAEWDAILAKLNYRSRRDVQSRIRVLNRRIRLTLPMTDGLYGQQAQAVYETLALGERPPKVPKKLRAR